MVEENIKKVGLEKRWGERKKIIIEKKEKKIVIKTQVKFRKKSKK